MPRAHLVAYLLISAAVGYLAATVVERSRARGPRPGGGGQAIAAESPADPPAASQPGRSVPGLADAERSLEAGDWNAAVDAIRTMIASGPEAWDDAAALVLAILSVEDPVEYTMREAHLDALATEIAFHKHTVPLARAAGTVAAELYLELAYGWLGEAHEGAFLVECLADATDEDGPRILRALEGNLTPALLPAFMARLRTEGRPQAQALYLRAVAASPAVAENALRELASGSDRLLAEMAAAALQMVRPPASGFLVLNVPGKDESRVAGRPRPWAGLQRGDIVTAVEGATIDGEDAWKKAAAASGGKPSVMLKVVRRGQEMDLRAPGTLAGVKGKFVREAGK